MEIKNYKIMKVTNYPAHADVQKQSTRLKRRAVEAKIVWVGRLCPTAREKLLVGLNKEA